MKYVDLKSYITYVSRGITPKYVNSEGILVINQRCIRNGQIDFSYARLTSKQKSYTEAKFLEPGDILINSTGTGTLGRIALFKGNDQKVLADSHVSIVRISQEYDTRFVAHYLYSKEAYIATLGKGATNQQELSKEAIYSIPVPKITVDKQSKIAEILSAYDDLIENNQKQIKLLEEAAMRLYKEWFVNLRFPGYENSKIVDGVPEGWEKCNLGLYAKVKSGYAFKSSWWKHNGVPVIKIKDIQDNTVNLSQLDCVDISNANKAIDFKVVAGDLLIAMTGATTGKIAIVPIADDMLVNQRVGKFFLGENPIAKLPFLYSTLQEANSHNWALNFANGSAQPNISPTQIESLEILFSERFVSLYNEKMQPYFESIIKLRRLINRAQQARDKLLPKLMSGEIEV